LTTASSNILANFIPNYDASSIKDLSKQQMVLMGRAALDELGMGGHTYILDSKLLCFDCPYS
jgi:aspartyl-tRNA(Asn)/glutamyl-tRNA(Gln) amidotransferase subunit A